MRAGAHKHEAVLWSDRVAWTDTHGYTCVTSHTHTHVGWISLDTAAGSCGRCFITQTHQPAAAGDVMFFYGQAGGVYGKVAPEVGDVAIAHC